MCNRFLGQFYISLESVRCYSIYVQSWKEILFGQIFFSEDVSDNDIVWKTRDDDASLNIGVPLSRVNECSTPRGASKDIANGAVRARVVVVSPEKSNSCDFQVM